tara:strand:- start:304 stop:834 length:531 start_codon:yes stop_codon:yes gene_type:complete
MRTLTVKKGSSTGDFAPGWKLAKVRKASYGTLDNADNTKFMDVWFEKYPDTFNLRVYAKHSKVDNEEYAIGQVWRFSGQGVVESVDTQNDNETIIKIDDSPENLVGASFWIYLYKNDEGYARVLQRVAPDTFSNQVESFSESDTEYWKGRHEKYFNDYVAVNLGSTVTDKTDEVPF